MSKWDSLFRLESNIFRLYNKFIRLKFIFDFKEKKIIRKNSCLSRQRNSDSCFILGNGPSLKNVNLDRLKDYDTFSVNYFYRSNLNFSSTYHVMVDNAFWQEESAIEYLFRAYSDQQKTKFIFRSPVSRLFDDRQVNKNRAYFVVQKFVQYEDYLAIDMTYSQTACMNVVLAALQCAIFMGYEKIYLLGCDFNQFATMHPSHFYSKGTENRTCSMASDLKFSAIAMQHHYAIEKYSKLHDIKILNATDGSLIDAYERITVDDALNNNHNV